MTAFSDKFHSHIEDLSSTGKLSKTGTGRFAPLIAELAAKLSASKEDIYVVSCARPNNLNIRLTQGTSQHRHKALALGVIPNAADVSKIVASGLTAGAHFIGDGKAQYDAVGIVVKDAGRWVIGGLVEASDKGISALLREEFPAMVIRTAKPATSSAEESSIQGSVASQGDNMHAASVAESLDISTLVRAFFDDLKAAQLIFSEELVTRFCASLLARRFLLLTGLSGSGKTKLAEAFARWLTPKDNAAPCYKIIPVGADWTSSEQVMGYADALNPERYEIRPPLELLLQASQDQRIGLPHVLILDEMNLSHVERYFSEFLSAMETGARIDLYSGTQRKEAPAQVTLPPNLFIVGTVNVDETTYLFSPKVLDRANVVEFRADEDEVFSFLETFGAVDLSAIDGRGAPYISAFIAATAAEPQLRDVDKEAVAEAFRRIFRVMGIFGREFGFRTLRDVGRYVHFHRLLVGDEAWNVDDAIDAQIYQRVLPRLHGSRNQVQQLIWALGAICMSDQLSDAAFETDIVKPLIQGLAVKNPFDMPDNVSIVEGGFATAKYPLSCEKLFRMSRKVRDGFVSFMEA